MSDHVLIVFSDPTPGHEDEYNDWYTNVHLDEVLAVPGFVGARRFQLGDAQLDGFTPSGHRYMAIYEIDGDESVALGRLVAELENSRMVLPDSIQANAIAPWCFTPVTPRVVSRELSQTTARS